MNRIRLWLAEGWEAVVWRLYRRTGRYFLSLQHEELLMKLLDEMGAPTLPGNDPKRTRYGAYGRLKAWWHDREVDEALRKTVWWRK